MKIKLIDNRKEVVDAAGPFVESVRGDYFIEGYRTKQPVFMTASNPRFTMGGGLDAIFVDHFPELVRFKQYKGGGQERIANVVFAITVDDSYKATKDTIEQALRFAIENTGDGETLCISGIGTGIGGLSVNDFVLVLKNVLHGVDDVRFDADQENSGVNRYGHYQFGSNCCIGCKRDRPLKEPGEWCEVCKNYQSNQK